MFHIYCELDGIDLEMKAALQGIPALQTLVILCDLTRQGWEGL